MAIFSKALVAFNKLKRVNVDSKRHPFSIISRIKVLQMVKKDRLVNSCVNRMETYHLKALSKAT